MIEAGVRNSTTAMLAEIAASPVRVYTPPGNTEAYLEFCLPHGCVASGLLIDHPYINQPYVMQPGRVEVPTALRGHGIGQRLVSALAHRALEKGVEALAGPVESQHTIRMARKLFGDDRLSFADEEPTSEDIIQLPLTAAQAILSLERAELLERNPDYREIGLEYMYVDLAGIPLDTLERPLPEDAAYVAFSD